MRREISSKVDIYNSKNTNKRIYQKNFESGRRKIRNNNKKKFFLFSYEYYGNRNRIVRTKINKKRSDP